LKSGGVGAQGLQPLAAAREGGRPRRRRRCALDGGGGARARGRGQRRRSCGARGGGVARAAPADRRRRGVEALAGDVAEAGDARRRHRDVAEPRAHGGRDSVRAGGDLASGGKVGGRVDAHLRDVTVPSA
jgi:hypothetical protein